MSVASTALAIRPSAAKPRRLRAPLTPPAALSDDDREPIGSLDLELAPTRDEQIETLNFAISDPAAYGRQFLVCVAQIGVTLHVNRRGGLIAGYPADDRVVDRQARMSPLSEHMRCARMQHAVAGAVNRHGCYTDRRPNDPHHTTRVVRDFLDAGYRLYLSPGNWVEESGSMPLEWWKSDDQDRVDEIERAGRAYVQLRARFAARHQVERIVRMLGKRNQHGFIVLERQP